MSVTIQRNRISHRLTFFCQYIVKQKKLIEKALKIRKITDNAQKIVQNHIVAALSYH